MSNWAEEDFKQALKLAGIMANEAQCIVGGRDITFGRYVAPCGIDQISELAPRLRKAVDNYNEFIVKKAME